MKQHHHYMRVRITLPFKYRAADLHAYVREAVALWQGQMAPQEPLRQAGMACKFKVSVRGDANKG